MVIRSPCSIDSFSLSLSLSVLQEWENRAVYVQALPYFYQYSGSASRSIRYGNYRKKEMWRDYEVCDFKVCVLRMGLISNVV